MGGVVTQLAEWLLPKFESIHQQKFVQNMSVLLTVKKKEIKKKKLGKLVTYLSKLDEILPTLVRR